MCNHGVLLLPEPDLRAFLKADREAHSCQYEEDARIKGNLIEVQAARIKHLEALETTERAHADALVDALRTEVEMHSARYGREPDICARCGFSYPCGFVQHALPLLAAHDELRGK